MAVEQSKSETPIFDWLVLVSEDYSPLDFMLVADNFELFLWGSLVTLELTFLALFFGGILCIPLAIVRAYKYPVINQIVWGFTYFFRGTPLLVQTYLLYFGLSQYDFVRESFLWGPVLSSAWWCALIVFTLNTAAYTTEFLRGAIETTPVGEVEAAKASGMNHPTMLRRIVLPSAFRRALPAYSNEVIFMLHGSVIASTITLQDILGVGRFINGRYYLAYEGIITAGIMYAIIVFGITRLFKYAEHRWLGHLRQRTETLEPAMAAADGIR